MEQQNQQQQQRQENLNQNQQQQQPLLIVSRLWDTYQTWACRHQSTLWWMEEVISHLLFLSSSTNPMDWNVASSSSSSSSSVLLRGGRWRDIVGGCLELHRFVLQQATTTTITQHDGCQPHQHPPNYFGTTMEPTIRIGAITTDPSSSSWSTTASNNNASTISMVPTVIRYTLTILQILYPIVQQVVLLQQPVGGTVMTTHHNTTSITANHITWRQQQQQQQQQREKWSTVQRYLERTRFLLRWLLLRQYWKALPDSVPPGLMMAGGCIQNHHHHQDTATVEQVMSHWKRQFYVGKRTGKQWNIDPSIPTTMTHWKKHPMFWFNLRIKCAELLYILRPLLYTELQQQQTQPQQNGVVQSKPFLVWIMAILLDIVSLWGLQPLATMTESSCMTTRNEWHRRRIRLVLYMLRAPIWERYTQPIAQRVGRSLPAVPILGNLLRHYVWDWLSYWKEYRLEEG